MQGQGHLITLFVDHLQRGAVRRAVWPDPDTRFVTGDLADLLRDGRHVGAHPGLEFGFGFIAAGCSVITPSGGRRLQVALRVGQHAFVAGVGVGGDFHQTGSGNLADLLPGQEVRTLAWCTGEIHRLVQRRIDPHPDRRQQGMPVIGAQHWQHASVEARIAIVETQHDRPWWQFRAAVASRHDLVDGNRLVVVLPQPCQLLEQALGAHGHYRLIGVTVFDIVVRDPEHVVFFGHGFSLADTGRSDGGAKAGACWAQALINSAPSRRMKREIKGIFKLF